MVDGIFIGCMINHTVLDETSFWPFFNTWSRISRSRGSGDDGDGDRVSEFPPVFDRQYLGGIIELPHQIPFPRHNEIPEKSPPPPLKQRMLHFSREKIAQLKAKANVEMETDKISSLQTLMAHLWISITRVRNLEKDESVIYGIIMSMRGRIKPELPQHYLGNSIKLGIVKTTAGELLENGLGWAAWEMNKMIASKTSEEVRKT
ncbi:protein ENHANCED PSEUDOMONAS SUSCEPTIBILITY 1 [Ziziphus jujuba]|uniref:Protein ENHANCED PSEUDOMONAS SUSCEPTIBILITY 1 n=1 Tax=Ziziphus jujuba TaxID=326968 RepID=A0ABM3IT04_ZIZJJ|nr:protein ENHANCED PSEUDOMONAS SUSCEPTIBILITY 1 [Ziziphus jujuba]